jgi:pimeloyl-ACP methyl ester carboxylesterase
MAPDVPATSAPKPRRTWRRLGWSVVRIVLLVYLGLTLVFAAIQTNLIFPGRASQGRPEARFTPPPGAELVTLRTAVGTPVAALFGPALTPEGRSRADAATCPTLLYFYGNGMCLATALDEFDLFRRLGANVLIPEYPGYGLSGGRPGESACYAAADAAYDHLLTRPDVDPARVVAAGWSLGGAVAIDLAARRPVAGLAVFSTFTRLPDLAALHFPFLPHGLLLVHRFDSRAKLPRVGCPILIGHGTHDSIIPAAMMDHLAAAARAPVTRLPVPGADHNDFFDAGRRPVAVALRRFLDGLAPVR